MRKSIWLFVSLLSLAFSARAADAELPPTQEDVSHWWKLHADEEVIVNEQPMPVRLRSRELAYLASVSFPGRSSNDVKQVLLIRPGLKEVREAGPIVHDDCVVLDINQDGISEVMALATRSEQGTTAGTRAIVQFDDWAPQVLHVVAYNDNLGSCGKDASSPACIENSVEWVFSDVNNDGLDELIERLEKRRGPNEEHLKLLSSKIQVYQFKQDRFLKARKSLYKNARLFW